MRGTILSVIATLILSAPATAVEPDEAEFVFVSDLLDRGFTPFATSGIDGSLFGMSDGAALYICLPVDSRSSKARRHEKLTAELENKSPDPTVPNIAVACILTQ